MASIKGQVVDQQGGAIQGATVLLLNNSAVRLQETKTDDAGTFVFRDIRPGDYVVEVERSAFTPVNKNISIVTGQTEVQVPVQMKVAGPGSKSL